MGFPQGSEAEAEGALNLGLKDQLTALEWIQANIGVFGGDKNKVTVFGQSAGSCSIGILYLNTGLEKLARAAIFESGSASTTYTFDASRRQSDWNNFVASVPECSSLASTSHTFECLRTASSSALLNATAVSRSKSREQFMWVPAIDGPEGVMPELPSQLWAKGMFSKIPFIAGTNLDEGTLFSFKNIDSDLIREWIVANCTGSPRDVPSLQKAATRILELYPDDPALGAPYNTGNETFGISGQYKRLAAIMGDFFFDALRRLWIQSASEHGIKTFGYLFADNIPQAVPPSIGVLHSLELAYLYPNSEALELQVPGVRLNRKAQHLSRQMMDYWISFATSLDPNDGKGTERPRWPEYTAKNQVLLQLNSTNTTVIPDDYRAEQIEFITSNAALFRR